MDCATARDLLGDELDGRLGQGDVARLEEHVAACADCAEERRGLASLRAAFRAMPRVAAPAGFRDSVVSSLPRGRVVGLRRTLGWIAAVAAVAVVAVTLVPVEQREKELAVAEKSSDARTALSRAAPPEAGPVPPADPALGPGTPAGSGAVGRELDKPPGRKSEEAPGANETPGDAAVAADEAASRAEGKAKGAAPPPDPRPEAAPAAAAEGVEQRVRYVVFTDAGAAEKFAGSLVAAADDARRDSAPPPAGFSAPAERPPAARDAAGGRDKDLEARKSEDLLKRASFSPRRVLVRATLAAPVADDVLRERVRRAGGEVVREEIESEFIALLDAGTWERPPTPAAPPLPGGGDRGAGGGGRGAGGPLEDEPSPGAASAAKKSQLVPHASDVIVVVLLEAPGATPPAPTAPVTKPDGAK